MSKNSMQNAVCKIQSEFRQPVRGFTTRSEVNESFRAFIARATQERSPRGFTLLIAVILASVVVTVGLALLDASYKQVVLASSAKQSQYAFFNADSGLECGLYWDQKSNAFSYANPAPGTGLVCNGLQLPILSQTLSGATRTTVFQMPCTGGGSSANVTVYKTDGSISCSATGFSTTCIYSDGYSNCSASDARRTERGLRALY